jgi:tetratricopeptide (TPR) repeat protein
VSITIQECEENVSYCRRNGNSEGEAIWLVATGARYRDAGNSSKALECYNLAVEIYHRLGNNNGVANTYDGIALTYDAVLGDLPRAIEYQKRAISLSSGENKRTYEQQLQRLLDKAHK